MKSVPITSVQRDVLRWMIETDGRAIFVLGHKQSSKATIRGSGDPAIAMSTNVYEALLRKRLVRASCVTNDVNGQELTVDGAERSGLAVRCAIGEGCGCEGWHAK